MFYTCSRRYHIVRGHVRVKSKLVQPCSVVRCGQVTSRQVAIIPSALRGEDWGTQDGVKGLCQRGEVARRSQIILHKTLQPHAPTKVGRPP